MQRCLWLVVCNWEGSKVQLPETLEKGESLKHSYRLTTSPFNLGLHLGIQNLLGWMFWTELSRALPGRARAAGVKGCITGKIPVQIKIKSCYQCSWSGWKMSLFILLEFAEAAEIHVHCEPLWFVSSPRAQHLMDGKAELAFLIQSPGCSGEGNVGFGASGNEMGVQALCSCQGIAFSACGPSWQLPHFLARCWMSTRKTGSFCFPERTGRCQKLNGSLIPHSPLTRAVSSLSFTFF